MSKAITAIAICLLLQGCGRDDTKALIDAREIYCEGAVSEFKPFPLMLDASYTFTCENGSEFVGISL